MVLHYGDQHFVLGFEVLDSPGVGYQVYGFGGAPDEYDLGGVFCFYEFGGGFAGVFVEFGCFHGEGVDRAVNVAIVVFVKVFFCFDDLFGFVGCGGVVEVDEGVSVYFSF